MAADDENQEQEQQPEEAAAPEPAEAPQEPAEEAEAEEAAEPAAEEAEAEEAAEPPAEEAPAEEPEEELSPKQRRKLERSRASGPPGPQRSPEERAASRAQRRSSAAGQRGRHRRRLRERRGERREGTPRAERLPGTRKVRLGTVVSSAAPKTITVRIERARRDPTYEKVMRRSNTVHAHDERDEANEGDVVRVMETRPLSRTKRWRLVEIVERAR
jgi:small subunit ribosomal protein S17